MVQILVVDDDPLIRELLTDVFEMSGYQIQTAVDGVSAVGMLEMFQPDCVVLDVMMPGMDGYAVLRSIRSRDSDCVPIPVIMLTAAAEPGSATRAWADGVDYYLAKPFRADEILNVVDRLLGYEVGRNSVSEAAVATGTPA